ncbi:MAG TPA: YihY/virulence factor BrkB family protein [Gemmatimonadaceae bacterium]|jgi:YihY family inner membrane protein|nr:YihY/virulence factor BrkB family protein [Gemmatimonadaceae bacterium]
MTRGPMVILKNPGAFVMRVLKSFKANQGLLLAGAVAYYTLLSLIPLLLLLVVVLSHVIEPVRMLTTLNEYVDFVAPGAGSAIVTNLRMVLANRDVIGVAVTVTMVISSALAFTVLENAMSVIFFHRVKVKRRRFIISALMPYTFILCLGIGFLIMTIVAGKLAVLATHNLLLSDYLLYLMGVGGEVLMLTAIYHVMPVGRLSWRHALVGGATATVLWEIMRHLLLWYYGSISRMQFVYGSFTAAVALLVSVEIAAILLLLGAQVIAEYERVLLEPVEAPPKEMRTQ